MSVPSSVVLAMICDPQCSFLLICSVLVESETVMAAKKLSGVIEQGNSTCVMRMFS